MSLTCQTEFCEHAFFELYRKAHQPSSSATAHTEAPSVRHRVSTFFGVCVSICPFLTDQRRAFFSAVLCGNSRCASPIYECFCRSRNRPLHMRSSLVSIMMMILIIIIGFLLLTAVGGTTNSIPTNQNYNM